MIKHKVNVATNQQHVAMLKVKLPFQITPLISFYSPSSHWSKEISPRTYNPPNVECGLVHLVLHFITFKIPSTIIIPIWPFFTSYHKNHEHPSLKIHSKPWDGCLFKDHYHYCFSPKDRPPQRYNTDSFKGEKRTIPPRLWKLILFMIFSKFSSKMSMFPRTS